MEDKVNQTGHTRSLIQLGGEMQLLCTAKNKRGKSPYQRNSLY